MPKPNFRINTGDKVIPVSSALTKEEVARQQIERAKKNGLEEVERFNKAFKAFRDEVNGLVIYKDSLIQIEQAIDHLDKNVINPMLIGKEIYGVPEHTYASLRLDLFKSLIEKYEGGKKK